MTKFKLRCALTLIRLRWRFFNSHSFNGLRCNKKTPFIFNKLKHRAYEKKKEGKTKKKHGIFFSPSYIT